jgi:hypothetical protein
MQVGIPSPNDTPSKSARELTINIDELPSSKRVIDEIMPKIIQKIRSFDRSILFTSKAPSKAEKISPEK